MLVQLHGELNAIAPILAGILCMDRLVGVGQMHAVRVTHGVQGHQHLNHFLGLCRLGRSNPRVVHRAIHARDVVGVHHLHLVAYRASCLLVGQYIGLLDEVMLHRSTEATELGFPYGNRCIPGCLARYQLLDLEQGELVYQIVGTCAQEDRRDACTDFPGQCLALVHKGPAACLGGVCNDVLAISFPFLGHAQHGLQIDGLALELLQQGCSHSQRTLETSIADLAHVVQEILYLVISHCFGQRTNRTHHRVAVVADEARTSQVRYLLACTICQLLDACLDRLDEVVLGRVGQLVTLLGFDIDQVGNQRRQLVVGSLSAVGMRELALQEYQGIFKPALQTVSEGFILDCLGAHLSGHGQDSPEAFMGQSQCSKAGQVIRLVTIGLVQLEHEVIAGLGQSFLARRGY